MTVLTGEVNDGRKYFTHWYSVDHTDRALAFDNAFDNADDAFALITPRACARGKRQEVK